MSESVELQHLAKSFGSVQAVRDVSLSIPAGQTLALLGPNGAGKSTTIDMVLGLAKPDSGTVTIFGRPPADAVANGSIGAMLQTGQLVQYLKVRELIDMCGSLYERPMPVDEVIALTDLADIADRYTDKLSGGQTQRVRFAVALVGNPRLLVLDEPTVALDVEARHAFWQTMRNVASNGATIVFATHYLEEADQFADRIVLMANGEVVADGPATEIKAKVGRRTIRATITDADPIQLAALPGVVDVDVHGDLVSLTCTDSDAALRALLQADTTARDIEVRGAGLEEAFLELTASAP